MTTNSPRTRDGASFPGGKLLRKAQARLARRRKAFDETKDKVGQTRPGSMAR